MCQAVGLACRAPRTWEAWKSLCRCCAQSRDLAAGRHGCLLEAPACGQADRNVRVLQLVPSLAARTGGVAASVVETCHALEDAGVETTIFTTDLPASASAATSRRVTLDELPQGAESLDIRLFRSRPPRRLAWSPALDDALA